LDYDELVRNGVSFVIIRGGFSTTKDNLFETHYNELKNRNINLGCYWYTYAKSVSEAKSEAYKFLEVVKNKEFNYPLYLDIEDKSIAGLDRNTLNEIVKTFGSIIEGAGYYFGVYSNLNWYRNIISGKELNKKYDWWIAYWGDNAPNNIDYGVWQNSSDYNLRGRNIDSDYSFKDYPSIIKNNKLNHLGEVIDIKPNVYIVKKGDTLIKIANLYNMNYKDLARYNNIENPNLIYPGQEIKIPSNEKRVYTVKRGDNLTKIANMFNTTVSKLVTLNNISNPNLIYPGQKIIIE